ncbi:MFS transporter [Rickettsiales endosymbiont of Paramecium tredecaurelia]|uniref:MFS transporter n=1 Tax=Candidatus Sarmatiella mevalonica TaxID=2770581 RepID=UPI0019244169|nr:MFS transporter [Candidatus Sarmatiella mevalonica]MBL3284773.1 MFS transporter [Candidatus Sarmatiella mevalonica]
MHYIIRKIKNFRSPTELKEWMICYLVSVAPVSNIIYNIALPQIAESFEQSLVAAQKGNTVYFIGFTLGIIILSPISDKYGRRTVVLFGVLLYCISIPLAIYAANFHTFLLARFILAVGASVGSSITQTIVRETYEEKDLIRAYAQTALYITLTPAIFAIFTGYMIEYLNWHSLFLIVFFISFVILILFLFKLPETNLKDVIEHQEICKQHVEQSMESGVYQKFFAKCWAFFKLYKGIIFNLEIIRNSLFIGVMSGILFSINIVTPILLNYYTDWNTSVVGYILFFLTIAHGFGNFTIKKTRKTIVEFKIITSSLACMFAVMALISAAIMYGNHNIWFYILATALHFYLHGALMPILIKNANPSKSKTKKATVASVVSGLYYAIASLIVFFASKLQSNFTLVYLFFCVLVLLLNLIMKFADGNVQKT